MSVDGNGALVKKVAGGVTTVYIGSHYEKQGSTVIKYYSFNGQRIAMNKAGVVYYLLGDHLGSTALTVNSSGSKVAELRYKAWGETRYTWGTTPTTYRYTGQRQEESLGLYQMGARWYDSYINRFLSPDTIIPQPGNPQSFNRYLYALGNPLRYLDPSGHYAVEFESEEARRLFENMGWDSPEEFIDWLLATLEAAAAANPEGELAWFMPHFHAVDEREGVTIIFREEGNPQGGKMGPNGANSVVYMGAGSIISKQSAHALDDQSYTNVVLPYVSIFAHELYHATAQPYRYANTLGGEQEAYGFQLKAAQELGLDWGADSLVGRLANSRDELRKAGYGALGPEVRWALTVGIGYLKGLELRRDEHNLLYWAER